MSGIKIIFRKIGGRIIPLRVSEHFTGAGTGAAIVSGAALASAPIRRKISEVIRGTGKKGLGGNLANFAADMAISTGLVYGAHRFGGSKVRSAINSFGGWMARRAF